MTEGPREAEGGVKEVGAPKLTCKAEHDRQGRVRREGGWDRRGVGIERC